MVAVRVLTIGNDTHRTCLEGFPFEIVDAVIDDRDRLGFTGELADGRSYEYIRHTAYRITHTG